ncbi:MAG: hypothetical protein ABEJ95_07165 [Candidatus Nanohalobium sp.]
MSSKGVSQVVATVLLLGISITAVSSAAIFISDLMDDMQGSVDDWLTQEDRQKSSEIGFDYGLNGTDGYLLLDLRNTGSRTLTVEEDGNKTLNMYLDGIPQDWDYVSGSGYGSQSKVLLDPGSVLRLNTTKSFPSTGSTVDVKLTGPYGVQANYICFSHDGRCQR